MVCFALDIYQIGPECEYKVREHVESFKFHILIVQSYEPLHKRNFVKNFKHQTPLK